MKIVFICGSFERGSDGVGDYTRRISQSLLHKGIDVSIIALRDSFVKNEQREIIETSDGFIRVLRLPIEWSLSETNVILQSEIDEINPDWISLQFVIFAFHAKGLPFGLGDLLSKAFKGRRLQIMFHELWLGIDKGSNMKYALWGFLQRRIVTSLLHKLKPSIVHTNSDWYATQLKKITNNVNVLPLFSNIPVVQEFYQKDRITKVLNSNSINFVVFGHISLFAPVEAFVRELEAIAQKYTIDFSITFIGKNNSDLDRWIAAWNPKFKINVLGIQSEFEVSKCLSQANIGISTTPYALIEKSGSFFALQDHGLPVINVSDLSELPEERKTIRAVKGLFEYTIGNLEHILGLLGLPENTKQLDHTRELFLNDLIHAKN